MARDWSDEADSQLDPAEADAAKEEALARAEERMAAKKKQKVAFLQSGSRGREEQG
jgi:hypothetical protein